MSRGMLEGEDLDRESIDLKLHLVDDLVFFQNDLRQFAVTLDERLHRTLYRRFRRSPKQQDLVPQYIQLLIYDPMIHVY